MTTTWTKISKPTTSWTVVPKISTIANQQGSPMGLLLALTYPVTNGTLWNPITKPTTNWTKITKAT